MVSFMSLSLPSVHNTYIGCHLSFTVCDLSLEVSFPFNKRRNLSPTEIDLFNIIQTKPRSSNSKFSSVSHHYPSLYPKLVF